jgi:hypothetical protein
MRHNSDGSLAIPLVQLKNVDTVNWLSSTNLAENPASDKSVKGRQSIAFILLLSTRVNLEWSRGFVVADMGCHRKT